MDSEDYHSLILFFMILNFSIIQVLTYLASEKAQNYMYDIQATFFADFAKCLKENPHVHLFT